jgi:hypothetical protein
MPKSNKELALQLLEQMLEVSASLDAHSSSKNPDQPDGSGWMTFHLNKLKELIENDD